jgi:hypothetical protein
MQGLKDIQPQLEQTYDEAQTQSHLISSISSAIQSKIAQLNGEMALLKTRMSASQSSGSSDCVPRASN